MTANNALFFYLESLGRKERQVIVRDIKTACFLTKAQWWNWAHGKTRIKQIYFEKINEVVGRDLFKEVTN